MRVEHQHEGHLSPFFLGGMPFMSRQNLGSVRSFQSELNGLVVKEAPPRRQRVSALSRIH